MQYIYKSYNIDYDFFNYGKKITILNLHGWGGNKNSFQNTIKFFKKKYNIISISFPPQNKKSITPLTLEDYSFLTENILKLHNLINKDIYIICHSFGFRITLLLSNKINIKKCIITAGAGIKNNTNVIKKIILQNKILDKNYNGSNDYKILDNIDKITFKNVIKKDLSSLLKKDINKAMIFWGKHDKETPKFMAKKIQKNIKNSTLILVKSNHFAYLEKNSYFTKKSIEFFNS